MKIQDAVTRRSIFAGFQDLCRKIEDRILERASTLQESIPLVGPVEKDVVYQQAFNARQESSADVMLRVILAATGEQAKEHGVLERIAFCRDVPFVHGERVDGDNARLAFD